MSVIPILIPGIGEFRFNGCASSSRSQLRLKPQLNHLRPDLIFARSFSYRGRLSEPFKMSLGSQIYSTVFKRNYAMLAAVFGAGFAFEMGFNTTMNKLWDYNNRGRQWKDIRHKYIEGGEEDEE